MDLYILIIELMDLILKSEIDYFNNPFYSFNKVFSNLANYNPLTDHFSHLLCPKPANL